MRLIRLGRVLGGRTPAELLQSMSATELNEQLAFSALEDAEWRKGLSREIELERQRSLPLAERVALQKSALRRR